MKGSNTKELRKIRKRRARIGNALLWATAVEVTVCGALTMLMAVCASGWFGTIMFIACILCTIWLEVFFRANAEYIARKVDRLFSKKKRTDVQDQSSGRKFIHVDFTSPSYQMARRSVK